jgi:hypothetical protein
MGLPECAVTSEMLTNLIEHVHTGVREKILGAFVLVLVFLYGGLDAIFFKRRDSAAATWFIALATTATWIGYPFRPYSALMGAGVFVFGMILIIIYYRRADPRLK